MVNADACTALASVAVSEAVLLYVPQLPALVALVTCIDAVPPGGRSPRLQVRVPLAIQHVPGPLYAGLMLQLIPGPVGRTSLRAADTAVRGPELLTASVYPTGEPAVTSAESVVPNKLRLVEVPWTKRVDTSEAVKARL